MEDDDDSLAGRQGGDRVGTAQRRRSSSADVRQRPRVERVLLLAWTTSTRRSAPKGVDCARFIVIRLSQGANGLRLVEPAEGGERLLDRLLGGVVGECRDRPSPRMPPPGMRPVAVEESPRSVARARAGENDELGVGTTAHLLSSTSRGREVIHRSPDGAAQARRLYRRSMSSGIASSFSVMTRMRYSRKCSGSTPSASAMRAITSFDGTGRFPWTMWLR